MFLGGTCVEVLYTLVHDMVSMSGSVLDLDLCILPWKFGCPLGVLESWYFLLGVLGTSSLKLKSKGGVLQEAGTWPMSSVPVPLQWHRQHYHILDGLPHNFGQVRLRSTYVMVYNSLQYQKKTVIRAWSS